MFIHKIIVYRLVISITPFPVKSFHTSPPVATEFKGKGKTISRESKTKLDFVSLTLILRVYMLIFISRKGHKGNDDEDEDEDENLLLTTLRTLVVTKFATTPAQA